MDAAQMDAILKLDVDERIRIVQIIWDSIAASPETVPLTAAERTTIEQLVAEDDADPGDVVTWPEARALSSFGAAPFAKSRKRTTGTRRSAKAWRDVPGRVRACARRLRRSSAPLPDPARDGPPRPDTAVPVRDPVPDP